MRIAALAAVMLLAACAGAQIDYSKRKADRLFLHKGLSQGDVIAAWGKPDNATDALEGGKKASTWEYDRVYQQGAQVAYWPRSQFALTFIDGKLRRWVERQP